MTTPTHTVHVRVNDAATGQPTPVRIRFTTPAGAYLAPLGRWVDFATHPGEEVGGDVVVHDKKYTYINGNCEILLPTGPVIVEAHKGPEYAPLRQQIARGVGQTSIRLSIERWVNLRRQGWYSGDGRAHYLSPHAALLEGAAGDLAVVNLLAFEETRIDPVDKRSYHCSSNLLAFSGQQPALAAPGHIVIVNTLNVHPALGSLALLNCHRIVYPLRIGVPENAWANWTLADWCAQCHRKGGLVVWCDTSATAKSAIQKKALADLFPDHVDALETTFLPRLLSPDSAPDWYGLLKRGFRVPLLGSSGKRSNGELLGGTRTYVRLQNGEDFTYKSWVEAIRSGRTFVTMGPLLSFTIDGLDPGAVISMPATGGTVRVQAEAQGLGNIDRLEIIANGEVVADAAATGSPSRTALEVEVPVTTNGWLAARCRTSTITAHTSPIYVRVP